ncbi:MAG: bifunctional metallophosphatase/5-nucleotidase [Segetibacter sp.]|nr:bifunctional metallophosphatase/5-nucleotidase [Segetibacter sp.]
MQKNVRWLLAATLLVSASCKTTRNATATRDDNKIKVVFVQVNDVYEIAPLAGGKEGGMARVATVKKQYQQVNPNTFLIMSGDFVSPSVYNSLQYEGKRIRGKQMVEAMNAAGTDFVVFGNHEFDINENELQDRINESGFLWISSNAFHKTKGKVSPFSRTTTPNAPPFPETYIMNVKDKDGTTAKIGFIGLVLPFNKADFVSYTDPLTTAKTLYDRLKDSVDAVVAITHQTIEEDQRLAREIPGLAVILGGHEHDQRFVKEGNVYITKAHANAKSAYIVKLNLNKKNGKLKVDPELKYINESVASDSSTHVVVEKWNSIAEKNYSSLGFDAKAVVLNSGEPLDGREAKVRSGITNLTKLLVAAIQSAAPQADIAFVNSGSIRVDDILPLPVTQYDIIRTLPFGGGIREADMKGSLVIQTLNAGTKNRGTGGFLQYNENIAFDASSNTWKMNNVAIDPAKTYRVAMSDFLFTGKEANMDFLNPKNPEVVKTYDAETAVTNPKSDIRLAIVKYLQKK